MTDEMEVEAIAKVIWTDFSARIGGEWPGKDSQLVAVIQCMATARRALEAVRALRPAGEPVAWKIEPGGLPVATIKETPDAVLEIARLGRAGYSLVVHRRNTKGLMDDLSIDLTDDHLRAIGNLASPIIDAKVAEARGAALKEAVAAIRAKQAEATSVTGAPYYAGRRDGLGWAADIVNALRATPTAANATEGDGRISSAANQLAERVEAILGRLGPGGYLLPAGAAQTNYLQAALNELRSVLPASPDTKEKGRG